MLRACAFLLLLLLQNTRGIVLNLSRDDMSRTLTEKTQSVMVHTMLKASDYAVLTRMLEDFPIHGALVRSCKYWTPKLYADVEAYVDANPDARWLLSPWCTDRLPFSVRPSLKWHHLSVDVYEPTRFMNNICHVDAMDTWGEYRFNFAWWEDIKWEKFIAGALDTPLHRYLTPLALGWAGEWEPQLLQILLAFIKQQDEPERAGILRIVYDRYNQVRDKSLRNLYEDFFLDMRAFTASVDDNLRYVLSCIVFDTDSCNALDDFTLLRTDFESRHLGILLAARFQEESAFKRVIGRLGRIKLSQYDYLSVMQTILYYPIYIDHCRHLISFERFFGRQLSLFDGVSALLTPTQNIILFRKTRRQASDALLALEHQNDQKTILEVLAQDLLLCPYLINGRPAEEFLSHWLFKMADGDATDLSDRPHFRDIVIVVTALKLHFSTPVEIPMSQVLQIVCGSKVRVLNELHKEKSLVDALAVAYNVNSCDDHEIRFGGSDSQ